MIARERDDMRRLQTLCSGCVIDAVRTEKATLTDTSVTPTNNGLAVADLPARRARRSPIAAIYCVV
jgi:hypothetical protein